jgi:hypothetical protein
MLTGNRRKFSKHISIAEHRNIMAWRRRRHGNGGAHNVEDGAGDSSGSYAAAAKRVGVGNRSQQKLNSIEKRYVQKAASPPAYQPSGRLDCRCIWHCEKLNINKRYEISGSSMTADSQAALLCNGEK